MHILQDFDRYFLCSSEKLEFWQYLILIQTTFAKSVKWQSRKGSLIQEKIK